MHSKYDYTYVKFGSPQKNFCTDLAGEEEHAPHLRKNMVQVKVNGQKEQGNKENLQ